MGVTVGVNKLSVVHKDSGGVSTAALDVCKLQVGPTLVMLPLPNIAESKNLNKGTKKVRCDGQPVAIDGCVLNPTRGDEAGSQGGVLSGKIKGYASFIEFSFDVKFEGKGVARAFDHMMHNDKNTMLAPILQGPVGGKGDSDEKTLKDDEDDEVCGVCGLHHKKRPETG